MNAHFFFFFFVSAPGHLSLWSVIYNEACDYRGGLGGGRGEKKKNTTAREGQVRTVDAVVTSMLRAVESSQRLAVSG